MLRRVEPRLVTVWVATSDPCGVSLELYDDIVAMSIPASGRSQAPRSPIVVGATMTIPIGVHLHLAVVAAELRAGTAPLTFGARYSYNLVLDVLAGDRRGQEFDLGTLGLLTDPSPPQEGYEGGLGYVNNQLPGFVLAPPTLAGLRVAHCSCNKLHGEGQGVLAHLDDLVYDAGRGPDPFDGRPHLLLLTGDQIYADDVATALLPALTQLGDVLLGTRNGTPRETVDIPAGGGSEAVPGVPISQATLPAGRRQALVASRGGLTSEYAANHLIGFGEFAALYLLSWSPELWSQIKLGASPEEKKGADASQFADAPTVLDENAKVKNSDQNVNETLEAALTPLQVPRSVTDEAQQKAMQKALSKMLTKARQALAGERKRVSGYGGDVWAVRRALANIPTLTICDDHEVTDDWFMTGRWKQRVLASSLGRRIIRNALVAYVVFQGWGNDPVGHRSGPGAELLAAAQALFDTSGGPNAERLLGLDGSPQAVRFHYTVDGPAWRLVVLDTRTHRAYPSADAHPGLLNDAALDAQLPKGPLPSGLEALLVVSPAPVPGPPLLEDLLQPLAARAIDLWWMSLHRSPARAAERAITGIDRGKPTGEEYFDVEGWSANPDAFEKLLARLATYRTVVIFAGDVHYGASFVMDYATSAGAGSAAASTARIVGLTSSATQNQWLAPVTAFMQRIGWSRALQGIGLPARRFGWRGLTGPPFVVDPTDPGQAEKPPLRGRLLGDPVVLPGDGWQHPHRFSISPQWWWTLQPLTDVRPDTERPLKARPTPISPDLPDFSTPGDRLAPGGAYSRVAAVHADSVDRVWFSRDLVFGNNLGEVVFLADQGLSVQHTLHSVRPDPEPDEKADGYTQYVTSLAPPDPASVPVPTSVGG
jgi:hypothetical protein